MKRNDDTIKVGDIHNADNGCAEEVQNFASIERDIIYKSYGQRICNADGIHIGSTGSFPRSIHDLDTGENHMDEGDAFLACCDGQAGNQCNSDHRFFYSTEGDSIDDVIEAIGETFASVGDSSTLTASDAAQLEKTCGSATDGVLDNNGGLLCHVNGSNDYIRNMDVVEKAKSTYCYPEICEILRSLNGLPYLNPDFADNVVESLSRDSQSKKQRDSKDDEDAIEQNIPGEHPGWATKAQEYQRNSQCDEDAQIAPERGQRWMKKEPIERKGCIYQENTLLQRETNEHLSKKDGTSNANRQCHPSYTQEKSETHDVKSRQTSNKLKEYGQNKDIAYVHQQSNNACTQTRAVPVNVGFNCRLFQEEPLVDSLIQDWASNNAAQYELSSTGHSSYSAAPVVHYMYQDPSSHPCSHLEHGLIESEEIRSYPSSFWYYPDLSPSSGAHIEQSLCVNQGNKWNQEGCKGNVCTYPDLNYLEYMQKEKRECKRSRGRRGIVEHNQQGKRGCRLWEFIRNLLLDPVSNPSLIRWEDREAGTFRLVQSKAIARIWGSKKGNEGMNYEKLSRAMRYYYKRQIFAPVYGKRLVYSFGPRATGWRAAEK